MDTGRVETLLNQGWSLVGLLHQWLSSWAQVYHDADELVDLISSLQSFWACADDLKLKRLSRNTLVLEEFFERVCAKRVDVTSEHLKDLRAGIANFEDLLLGYEATGEEPVNLEVDVLQRLERHSRHKSGPVKSTATTEIRHRRQSEVPVVRATALVPVSTSAVTALATVDEPRHIPTVEVVTLVEPLTPKRLEQKNAPHFDQLERYRSIRRDGIDSLVTEELLLTPEEASEVDSDSQVVLILEESLFYRHLLQMALRSAGYETETIEPLVGEAYSTTRELLVPCRVILVTAPASCEMAPQIEEYRQTKEVKVIGLKLTEQDESFGVDLDACVVKSLPQQLISVLDQLLSANSDLPRKIA